MPGPLQRLSQFWQELKRRNVVRRNTVYAATAFVILEVASIVQDPLNLPEWTLTLVIVLLCIGFIISVIISWIYDINAEGELEKTKPGNKEKNEDKTVVSSTWKIASIASFVVIVGLIVFNILPSNGQFKESTILERSIAVLPLKNMSEGEEFEYLGDAITDEIIMQLYKINSFEVRSRTSVMQYKSTDKTIPVIGEELKVNYLLEGSIQRRDNKVRILVQLIKASTDDHLWGDDFEGEWKDIFDIQVKVSKQVARELKAVLTPDEIEKIEKIPTDNSEAYSKYLLGNNFQMKRRNVQDVTTAINLYQEAIKLDPGFALAYAAIGSSYAFNYWWLHEYDQQSLSESKKAIDKAFEIEPELPEAYIALGNFYYYGLSDYPNALKQFQKALEFTPNNPDSKYFIAAVHRRLGNWEKALEGFQEAFDSDPVSSRNAMDLALSYSLLGQFQVALDYIDLAIRISSDEYRSYEIKIAIYLNRDGNTEMARRVVKEMSLVNLSPGLLPMYLDIYDGNYQQALDFLTLASTTVVKGPFADIPKSLYYALLYDLMNLPEKSYKFYDSARIELESMLIKYPEDSEIQSSLGIAYAGLGQKDKAIELGRQAIPEYRNWQVEHKSRIDLARIYVMVKEYDAALEQLAMISTPGIFSANSIRMDPIWKPLLNHPDYEKLLKANSNGDHSRSE